MVLAQGAEPIVGFFLPKPPRLRSERERALSPPSTVAAARARPTPRQFARTAASREMAASVATSASAPGFVEDFFSTIEEVGLADIAKECGLDQALGPRGDGSAFGAMMGADADGPGGPFCSDSQLSSGFKTDGSQGGMHSPPTVHMPQCASIGPSVPADLQDMVSGGGARRRARSHARTAHPRARRHARPRARGGARLACPRPFPKKEGAPSGASSRRRARALCPRPPLTSLAWRAHRGVVAGAQSPPRRRSGSTRARAAASRATRACGTFR